MPPPLDITYTSSLAGVTPAQLTGFFQGWPSHPTPETHLRILQESFVTWLAFDQNRCVGFINAISDGVFCAFIPLLEVLPDYQGHGIGSELVRRMNASLGSMYAVDLVCDAHLLPFYEKLGFRPGTAVFRRNYQNQRG